MTISEKKTFAQISYEARQRYMKTQGVDLPPWDALSDQLKEAERIAAYAVAAACAEIARCNYAAGSAITRAMASEA